MNVTGRGHSIRLKAYAWIFVISLVALASGRGLKAQDEELTNKL